MVMRFITGSLKMPIAMGLYIAIQRIKLQSQV